jgi:hypothetical protein
MKKGIAIVLLAFGYSSSAQIETKQHKGFTDLDTLAKAFIQSLKSSPEELRKFCALIVLDDSTVRFLEKRYKWTPKGIQGMRSRKLPISMLLDRYYGFALDFREELISRRQQLDSLSYTTRKKIEQHYLFGSDTITMSESRFYFGATNVSYCCSFGEMYKVGGYWKTFTDPRFSGFPFDFPPQKTDSSKQH